MASRAKIILYPKLENTGYCLDKLQLVDKSSSWTYDTSDWHEDGYLMTNEMSSITLVNQLFYARFKAIQGYKITSCYKTNSGDTSNKGNFSIDSNGYVTIMPWESGTAPIVLNYIHFNVEKDSGASYHLTKNLTHCSSDAKDIYTDGENATITITCDSGYKLDEPPILDMDGTQYFFTVSADRATATINFTATGNMSINAVGTAYKALTLNLTNCTCNMVGEVKQGHVTLVLTADSGYYFNDNVTLLDAGTALTNIINNFTDGATKCVIEHKVTGDITITATATLKVEKISNFANLYRVSNEVLDHLSKARFFKLSGSADVSEYDYGQYITALYTIPFALDESMIADVSNIQLGAYDSRVKADTLKTYNYSVNMGTISIPEKYHNAYDYMDTICILHLPYCDSMQIESHYIINRVIKIEYKIDLYSGNCTVNVTSDITGEIVASQTFMIGSQIPFMQMQTGGTSNQLKQVVDNGIATPYIEVVRNIPYNINTLFGRETVDFGKLENYRGFIRVSEIMLNINAKNDEKEEIISLLKSGVFINEKID